MMLTETIAHFFVTHAHAFPAALALKQWFLNFFVCFTLLTKMIIRFTPYI